MTRRRGGVPCCMPAGAGARSCCLGGACMRKGAHMHVWAEAGTATAQTPSPLHFSWGLRHNPCVIGNCPLGSQPGFLYSSYNMRCSQGFPRGGYKEGRRTSSLRSCKNLQTQKGAAWASSGTLVVEVDDASRPCGHATPQGPRQVQKKVARCGAACLEGSSQTLQEWLLSHHCATLKNAGLTVLWLVNRP